jgi:hypothetical protein
MTEAPGKTISISNPVHVVCEGNSDKGFLEHLIQDRGLRGFDIGCPTPETVGAHGLSGFRKYFLALETSTDRPKLKGLLVVADADENADRRFQEVRGAVAVMGCDLNEPFVSQRFDSKNVTVEVFLMPGRGRTGTLEHLLLDAIFEGNRELEPCVNSFRECLRGPGGWSENKQAKMRLHALIAGCCEEEPSTNLATVWNKRGNPIPLNSSKFDELAETLRHFATL